MKYIIKIFLLFILLNSMLIYSHKQAVHMYITQEGYTLLKNYIGRDIAEMMNHVNLRDGYVKPIWQNLNIMAGAWREDEEDIVFGYCWQSGWSASISHFWDSDDGDFTQNTFLIESGVGTIGSYRNTYDKLQYFAYPYKAWEIKCPVPPGSQHFKLASGGDIYIPHAGGFGMKYNSLTELYTTGRAWITGYYGVPNSDWRTCNYEVVLGTGWRDVFTWEILGRMCHLVQDMSVPAHTRRDEHGLSDDDYENWISENNHWATWNGNNSGSLINPFVSSNPLHYLLYTTQQIANHFGSTGPYCSVGNDLIGGNSLPEEVAYLTSVNLSSLGEPVGQGPFVQSTEENIRDKTFPQAIRATAGLLYWFATECNLFVIPLPPPPAHLWTAGNYVGYGAANSYFSSTITIGNNGGEALFYEVNHRYRNYDCGFGDPEAPLLPYNYVYVPGCYENEGWLTPSQQTVMSCWQYRPNIYIPANEYFRAFYNYAEVCGSVNSNIVNIWGYVGFPPPGDNCGGGDEPNLAMKSNPETELFNKAFSKSLQTSNMAAALGGKIFKNHKSIIENHPDSTIACYALNSLISQVGKNSDSVKLFMNYIDDLQSRLSNKKIGAYAQYIKAQFEEDFNKRIDILDKLYKKHSTTPLGLIAIADKFYQYLGIKEDSLARLIAEEIIHAYPGSPIIQEIRVALGEIPYSNSNISELFQKSLANGNTAQIKLASTGDSRLTTLTNYPNPFNPSTVLTFTVCESVETELSIYNITGQKIKTLHTGHQQEGVFNVVWDGHDDYGAQVASGIYLAILITPKASITRKIVLLK